MPDTTETVVIRWLVENADAIARHKELRTEVKAIREQLKFLAKETGSTYQEMAKAMTSAFTSDAYKRANDELRNNPLLNNKEQMAKARAEIAQFKQAMTIAMSIIRKEVTDTASLWVSTSKQIVDADKQKASTIQQDNNIIFQSNQATTQAMVNGAKQQTTAMAQVGAQAQATATQVANAGAGAGGGGGAGGFLSMLGGFGKGALGFAGALVGITSLLAVVRQTIRFFTEATEAGQDFAKSLFAMEVGVRALQRAGVDITLADMNTQLGKLKERFGVFSRTDLVEGSAAFLNLNRDMGFTKEQLFELQNAVATLAVVNGRSMDEVQKTVALALSSGYTEGLQRLGVSINRVTIAAEASAMGWKNGYTSLTEVQRAAATYNLVIRKTAIYQEDLLRYQETLPGKIDVATKAIQDQTVSIGANLLGVKLWVTEAELAFLKIINAFTATKAAFEDFRQAFLANQVAMKGSALDQGEINRYSEAAGQVWEAGVFRGGLTPQQMFEKYGFESEKWNPKLGAADQLVSDREKAMQQLQKIVDDNLESILDAEKDYQEKSKEAWSDYQQDLLNMQTDYWRDVAELELEWERRKDQNQLEHDRKETEMETDHQRDLEKITQDAFDKAVDVADKYQRDVAEAWANYYGRVADAQAKYENQQYDAEVDFQEKMRKLREGLMFDLEDAIRVRDARQVLQLLRRYSLEKTQAEREYQLQKDKAAKDFADQMAQLARQRDERLAQLYIEMQARLAAIAEEARREKEQRDAKWEQDKKDEDVHFQQQQDDEDTRYAQAANDRALKYQQDKDDRKIKYDQEITDLKNHLDARYKEITDAMADELDAVTMNMDDIREVLNATLGPGGAAEQIYKYFAQIMANIGALTFSPTLGPNQPPIAQAEGGIGFANRATDVKFGEAGPELAMFIPLNKQLKDLGNSFTSTANIAGGEGKSGKSQVQVEVLLDPRLEGRIIDTALDNVADVIIRRLR